MYLTQFVYGAIEVPSKLMVYYLLEKIGRRKTEAGAQFLAGISLMINIFIPKGETANQHMIMITCTRVMVLLNILKKSSMITYI